MNKTKIYTVTIIRVMVDEACEYSSVPFLDRNKAIKYFDEESMKWLRQKKEHEKKYNDENFDIQEWYEENIYEEYESEDCKLIHLTFDEGEEKIFELQSYEVE